MSGSKARRFLCSATALAACALSGCTTERRDGDTTVFTFAIWVPLLAFVVGVVLFLLGRRMTDSARGRWTLMILGVVASFGLAPGLLTDRATVDSQGFTLRTGFWFLPNQHEVKFADLSRIDLTSETRMTRRGRSTSYYLSCVKKSGEVQKVPVGTLMQEGARDRILERAEAARVPVNDRT